MEWWGRWGKSGHLRYSETKPNKNNWTTSTTIKGMVEYTVNTTCEKLCVLSLDANRVPSMRWCGVHTPQREPAMSVGCLWRRCENGERRFFDILQILSMYVSLDAFVACMTGHSPVCGDIMQCDCVFYHSCCRPRWYGEIAHGITDCRVDGISAFCACQ